MPRYFFDLAPSQPFDEDGEELPDDAAAKEVARQTARDMLRDGTPTIPDERVVVSNEKGELVFEVYLEEVAQTEPNESEVVSSLRWNCLRAGAFVLNDANASS